MSADGDSLYVCAASSDVAVFDADGRFCGRHAVHEQVPLTAIEVMSGGAIMSAADVTPGTDMLYGFTPTLSLTGQWVSRQQGGFTAPMCRAIAANKSCGFFLDWYENVIYAYDPQAETTREVYTLKFDDCVKNLGITDAMDFMMRQREADFVINWGVTDSNLVAFYIIHGKPYVAVIDMATGSITKQAQYVGYMPEMFLARDGESFISVITYENYDFFKQNLPATIQLPAFDAEHTNAILLTWKIKK
jgi:hypothetical protein